MKKRSGYIAVIGNPNAGKSTLINEILKFSLSVVNRKVQTTRNKIIGILTEENYQMVFLDTPGILKPKYELHKFMVSEIKSSLEESDLILHVIDVSKINFDELSSFENDYKNLLKDKFRIIVLNKADLINKNNILPVIHKLSAEFKFNEIIPVSALKNENIDELKKLIVSNLPENEFFFEESALTDKPEKFFAAEIIREKILSLYHEEIPYSVFINITDFIERNENLVVINADIILERNSQKIIVIGKEGQGLKKLGEKSRKELEKFLNKKVYLSLFVKVKKDWRNNKMFISSNIS